MRWIGGALRLAWAAIVVDFETWGRVRTRLGKPRVRRLFLLGVALAALGVVIGAALKDGGAIRRSHLLGERFANRAARHAYWRSFEAHEQGKPSWAASWSAELRGLRDAEEALASGGGASSKLAARVATARKTVFDERVRAWRASTRFDEVLDEHARAVARGDVPTKLASELYYAERAVNIYEPHGVHRPYAPTFGMLFAPLALLPLGLLRLLWALGQVGLLAAILHGLGRLGGRWYANWERYRGPVTWLTLLFTLRFLLRDANGGQTNLLLFGLCVGVLGFVAQGRARAAGVLLGFAIALKLTPLLLLAFLGVRRRFKTVIYAGLTAGLLFAAPLLLMGPRVYAVNFDYWFSGTRALSTADEVFDQRSIVAFDFGNQSLRNMVHRYLRTYPQTREDRPRWGYVDFGQRSPREAQRVARFAVVGLLLVTALSMGWRPPEPESLPYWVEGAQVLLLMLLVSPITWKAHMVALILPIQLLLSFACCMRSRWTWRVLVVFFVLVCASNRTTLGRVGEDLHLAYYVNTVGLLLVFVTLTALRARLRRLPPSVEGLPVPRSIG